MLWQTVCEKIDSETAVIQNSAPDEVLKIFHYQIVDSMAGSYDQNFTTMVFAEGDCRALAYYNANNLLLVAEEESFSLDHMKTMARLYLPVGSEFLGYCGLVKIWEFAQDVIGALDSLETKEDFSNLMNSFNTYVSTLHGWVHHYFPWHLGDLYPQKTKPQVARLAELSAGLPEALI